jgi:hypothetical protein
MEFILSLALLILVVSKATALACVVAYMISTG